MEPRSDLEKAIRETYGLVSQYDEMARLANDPKDQTRARKHHTEQQALLHNYLNQYRHLCQQLNVALAHDIEQIAIKMQAGYATSTPSDPPATTSTPAPEPTANRPQPAEPRRLPPLGNPFTPGTVVPPERFFGRTSELREILARLRIMGSVSLVGDARIGKSSLLRYLEANIPALLNEYGRYMPIYITMDAQRSQETFCKAILEHLLPHMPPLPGREQHLRALEQRLMHGPTVTTDEMVSVLEWTKNTDLRVVLLLDEFKALIEHADVFDDPFRRVLRSLYIDGKVALVLATRQPLTEIDGLDAYFVNGVVKLSMNTLLPNEAETLLRQTHERPFSDAEVRIALAVGWNHPLRLQSAGFRLYEWKGQPPGPIYDEQGTLRPQAERILFRAVDEEYDNALAASANHTSTPARRGNHSLLDVVNTLITRTYDVLDTTSGRFSVVALLLGLVALLLYALGILSLEQLREWQHLLSGGE